MVKPATLIVVDLETSGLLVATHKVLEIAAVAVTDDLEEVGRFAAVTNEARFLKPSDYDLAAFELHAKSGLLLESVRSAQSVVDVDKAFTAFIHDVIFPEPDLQASSAEVKETRRVLRSHP